MTCTFTGGDACPFKGADTGWTACEHIDLRVCCVYCHVSRCVPLRSMIGRIYLGQGKKAKAREWLQRAVDEERMPTSACDLTAIEARAEARKAMLKC